MKHGRIVAFLLLVLSTACTPPGKPRQVEDPQAPAMDFGTLFGANCAGCHGLDGKNGPGRILNDPLYLAILPREELRQILIHGRPGTAMPAWATSNGGPLNDKQIDILVNGVYQNWAKPVHLTDPPSYAAGNVVGNADAGRKLFTRNCFMCHGPGARVGLVTDRNYLSLVSNQMLRTSIMIGRPDLGMPDYRHLKLGKALTNQDVTDLVAFLASKRPPNAMIQRMNDSENGSGYGPGSPTQTTGGNQFNGGSSQQGVSQQGKK